MKYSNTFKDATQRWLSEPEGSLENVISVQSGAGAMQEEFPNPQVLVHASSIISTDNLQDEIKPSDSELEDQEEQLRKRKERLNLEGEIAIQMAKLNVLKSQSVSSSNSDRSGEKHHNLVKEQKKTQSLKRQCEIICSSRKRISS